VPVARRGPAVLVRGAWHMRRTIFYSYLVMIFAGLAYFIAIGLLRL
jgi:hypothetical protein